MKFSPLKLNKQDKEGTQLGIDQQNKQQKQAMQNVKFNGIIHSTTEHLVNRYLQDNDHNYESALQQLMPLVDIIYSSVSGQARRKQRRQRVGAALSPWVAKYMKSIQEQKLQFIRNILPQTKIDLVPLAPTTGSNVLQHLAVGSKLSVTDNSFQNSRKVNNSSVKKGFRHTQQYQSQHTEEEEGEGSSSITELICAQNKQFVHKLRDISLRTHSQTQSMDITGASMRSSAIHSKLSAQKNPLNKLSQSMQNGTGIVPQWEDSHILQQWAIKSTINEQENSGQAALITETADSLLQQNSTHSKAIKSEFSSNSVQQPKLSQQENTNKEQETAQKVIGAENSATDSLLNLREQMAVQKDTAERKYLSFVMGLQEGTVHQREQVHPNKKVLIGSVPQDGAQQSAERYAVTPSKVNSQLTEAPIVSNSTVLQESDDSQILSKNMQQPTKNRVPPPSSTNIFYSRVRKLKDSAISKLSHSQIVEASETLEKKMSLSELNDEVIIPSVAMVRARGEIRSVTPMLRCVAARQAKAAINVQTTGSMTQERDAKPPSNVISFQDDKSFMLYTRALHSNAQFVQYLERGLDASVMFAQQNNYFIGAPRKLQDGSTQSVGGSVNASINRSYINQVQLPVSGRSQTPLQYYRQQQQSKAEESYRSKNDNSYIKSARAVTESCTSPIQIDRKNIKKRKRLHVIDTKKLLKSQPNDQVVVEPSNCLQKYQKQLLPAGSNEQPPQCAFDRVYLQFVRTNGKRQNKGALSSSHESGAIDANLRQLLTNSMQPQQK